MEQQAPDTEEAGGEAGEAQFLSFALGTETCAVALAAVQEIIRVPRIVGVPLAPPAVAGLVNLRGQVLPVIDGRRLLGFGGGAPGAQARVVVLRQQEDYGLLVDAVAGVVGGEPEPPPAARDAVAGEVLAGALHAGGRVVMLLDPGRLAARELAADPVAEPQHGALPAPEGGAAEEAGTAFRYLTFRVAGQEYGLPVQFVQEIGRLPGELSRVPHAAAHLVGIAALRGRLLPLVDLRLLLDLPEAAPAGQQRVLVAGVPGGAPVGLLVDRVCEVLQAAGEPQALPALWERPEEADLQGMLSLDGGRRLVAVLAAERLLLAVLRQLEKEGEAMAETEEAMDFETEEDTETLVVFLLGEEEFGLPVGAVREILRVPEQLSRVPGAADFVEGMVNLRGKVLPVLDQRRQFGLAGGRSDRRQRILVLESAGGSAGFAVDAVREVLKVPLASLGPAPAMRGAQARLVGRVANLAAAGRMILVLDADAVLRGAAAPGLQEAA